MGLRKPPAPLTLPEIDLSPLLAMVSQSSEQDPTQSWNERADVVRQMPEFQASLEGQERLSALRDAAKAAYSPQLDLTPLMALTDAWSGSNLTKSYQRPKTQGEHLLEMAGYENAIQGQRDNALSSVMSGIKAQMPNLADSRFLSQLLLDQIRGARQDRKFDAEQAYKNALLSNYGRRLELAEQDAARKAEEAAAKRQAKERAEQFAKDTHETVLQDIGRAINIVNNEKFATGWGSAVFKHAPGTSAKKLEGLMESIRSNISIDQLNRMRAQSPTGGALGNVSEGEHKLLMSTLGNLDTTQDRTVLDTNLKRLWNLYNDIVHGKGAGPERFSLPFSADAPGVTKSGGDTVTVIAPNGKRGTIPRANLKKALDKGYRVAE